MNLLQKGDKIRLELGMYVYAPIPKKFSFSNTPFSTEIRDSAMIKIGRVYHKNVVTKEELVDSAMDAISSIVNLSIDELDKSARKNMEAFIDSLSLNFDPEEFDSSIYAGEYIVENAYFGGGGTLATFSGFETYPDRWHVFCVKVDNPSIRVNFYQTE